MRDVTIGSKADIGRDYAGLREDLSRRQRARVARGADRHWRLGQYWASMAGANVSDGHTHHWSRWDARGLDPGRAVWSGLRGVSDSYEVWRWQDPARRQVPVIRRTAEWLPRYTGFKRRREAQVATINYSESARSKQTRPLEDQWAEHLDSSLLYKWYTASTARAAFVTKRQRDTSRRKTAAARQSYKRAERIDCPGVGCLASDFVAAAAAELEWWPAAPLEGWVSAMLERLVGDGAVSSRQAVHQVCADKGVLEIRSWAERRLRDMQEQVRERLLRDSSCLVLLGDREREMGGGELPADLFQCGAFGF